MDEATDAAAGEIANEARIRAETIDEASVFSAFGELIDFFTEKLLF